MWCADWPPRRHALSPHKSSSLRRPPPRHHHPPPPSQVHARNKAVDPNINWYEVARAMAGFTGERGRVCDCVYVCVCVCVGGGGRKWQARCKWFPQGGARMEDKARWCPAGPCGAHKRWPASTCAYAARVWCVFRVLTASGTRCAPCLLGRRYFSLQPHPHRPGTPTTHPHNCTTVFDEHECNLPPPQART